MADFIDLVSLRGTRFGPVRLVAETGSTNADLLEAALAGGESGAVLVADHQREGRGRQRRTWHDEPGAALLVSVLLRPPTELADRVPLIPLVAGLAIHDAVAEVVGHEAVGLKWPNDVLAPGHDERKLAGILAELVTTDRGAAVVVGTGLNLGRTPTRPGAVAPHAISLAEIAGGSVDRDRVLEDYLVAFDRWLARLEQDQPIIDHYRQRCLTIGRDVEMSVGQISHRGRVTGISDTGSLILATDQGERLELSAGETHHRRH